MMTRRSILAAAALVTVPRTYAGAQTPRVRAATPPNDSGGELFYGADMGFFSKAGLDVQVEVIGQGALIPDGIMSGSLDIGGISIPAVALAHEKHLPFVMIAPGAVYESRSPTSALIVTKSSPIATARDLTGKSIGVRDLTNPGSLAARAWLDQNGGDSKSVRFVELPDSASLAALLAGRIDAASIATPFLDKALHADTRIFAKSYDAIAKEFMIAGWFTTRDYAQRNPAVIHAFDAAIRETARWANANHTRSAEILAKYAKITIPPTMTRVAYAEDSSPGLVQPFIDAAAKYGILHGSFPASELLYSG